MDIHAVTDRAQLQAFHEVEAAAHDHDYVGLPADPVEEYVPLLEDPMDTGSRVTLYVAGSDGVPVGCMSLRIPTLDNLTSAHLDLMVHPDHRRRGHGRQLLEHGIAQVQANGRSRIFAEVATSQGAPAVRLLDSVGAKPVLVELRRVLDLTKHVPVPAPVPDGYELVQWVDRVPDEHLEGAAYLMGRMTLDIPLGDMDYEPEKWDGARYREGEKAALARGRTRVATAAVHRESGTFAGITEIGVNRALPEVTYQWQTIVDPDHRGHGLGLVVKSWNHAYLIEQVPQAVWVNTWNAASNRFMIAVNEAVGFEVYDEWTEYQLDL